MKAAGSPRSLFRCLEEDSFYQFAIHLLIDNSNTRTKFALASEDQLQSWRATIPTSELSFDSIETALAHVDINALTLATIGSVVPEKGALLTKVLQELGLPCHLISARSRLPIAIDYPNPNQIGPDRLANAAAIAPTSCPAIVIDFGTAVTFDVISPAGGGTYLGGVIAPGLGAMCEGLHRRTALLPKIELAEPISAIGKSTEQAMQVGAVIGYRGLIREILLSLNRELAAPATIFATGGDAELIARGLPEISQIDPNLTLRGILRIGNLNRISGDEF